ncbi:MAG: thiamine-phosphate kinase [Pseudomonadota bacterium]
MGEFDLIARHLAPLASPDALGLTDDVAHYRGDVISKDVLVEGVHFLPTDPLDLIARKALRVNISDVIAKGATPTAYLLGMVWPEGTKEASFERFAAGLQQEQTETGIRILGGDTTVGPLMVISVTIIGTPGPRGVITRSGAEPGDAILVTGTIGDGILGLEAAKQQPPASDLNALPYRLPRIPFGIQGVVAQYAKASIDLSDGLIADAGHLATASGVGVELRAEAVPLSSLGQEARSKGRLGDLVTGGDDYQTLFAIDPADIGLLTAEKPDTVTVTHIGSVLDGKRAGEVDLVDSNGRKISLKQSGWDHFAS